MNNNIQETLDKTCKKQRAQRCSCSKLASSHTVQLWFSFKLARIVRKLTPVRNFASNCPDNQNWPQITLRERRFA